MLETPIARCPYCHGSGECARCDGTGINTALNAEAPECPDCGGTGECQQCAGPEGVTELDL